MGLTSVFLFFYRLYFFYNSLCLLSYDSRFWMDESQGFSALLFSFFFVMNISITDYLKVLLFVFKCLSFSCYINQLGILLHPDFTNLLQLKYTKLDMIRSISVSLIVDSKWHHFYILCFLFDIIFVTLSFFL